MNEFWDDRYKKLKNPPVYDNWLKDYSDLFTINAILLEIGVGSGPNIGQYGKLSEKNVYVCDLSKYALNIVRERYGEIHVFEHDMRNPFTFADGFFSLIVSDLSLHYFSAEITQRIINELYRILQVDGHCLVRVNSVGDYDSGWRCGECIEENYFRIGHKLKRFFNRATLTDFFHEWNCCSLSDNITFKYGNQK